MIEYMQISKAARYLKVTKQTLRNWDKNGKLRPYRHPMSRYRLYKRPDLDNILNRIETYESKSK